MSGNGKITPTMTVREVMTRYPRAERVFNKHGLTGCGGPKGPIEPIAFFATVHHVDPDELLRELDEVAQQSETEGPAPEPPATAAPADIYRPFVKSAIGVTLTVGCTLGAINLLVMALGATTGTTWMAITQAHGHAQIFGWVGLFIMGVAYHTLPRLKSTELASRPLALASFWLVLAGLSLRMVAQPLATSPLFGWLVVASGVLELVGASFFVYVAQRTLASSPQATDFYDKYIVASALWFWVLAAGTVGIAVYTARAGLDVIPAFLDVPYLHIALMGFTANMIFGYVLRTVPVFMGLRAPNKRSFGVIFWVLNLTVAVRALSWLVAPSLGATADLVGGAAGVIEWGVVVSFVYCLNLFRRPEMDISEAGATRGYEKYVKAAFIWLLVAVTMTGAYAVYQASTGQAVPHSLVGAYRHALTVGFISMMILGMSSRIIPVFTGVRLYSETLLTVSFVLFNLGNTLRVLSQPLADFVGGPFFVTMGISGFIEVTALALFAYNLWRTMDSPVEEEPVAATTSGPITKDMVVADVLERFPQALGVFVEHGFAPLKNPLARRTLARAVTVEQATRIHPADLDALLADLNRVQGIVAEVAAVAPPAPVTNGHITKEQFVGQVVERYPAALEVFVRHGFGHLRDENVRRTVAMTVSIEMATRIHGVDTDEIVRELNLACGLESAAPAVATIPDDRAGLRRQVEAALESVRPYLQADGGDVELVDVDAKGVVSVRLVGACGSCPASQMTLADGVERILKQQVPGVTGVVAVEPVA